MGGGPSVKKIKFWLGEQTNFSYSVIHYRYIYKLAHKTGMEIWIER
jgi:hypothetical protein